MWQSRSPSFHDASASLSTTASKWCMPRSWEWKQSHGDWFWQRFLFSSSCRRFYLIFILNLVRVSIRTGHIFFYQSRKIINFFFFIFHRTAISNHLKSYTNQIEGAETGFYRRSQFFVFVSLLSIWFLCVITSIKI